MSETKENPTEEAIPQVITEEYLQSFLKGTAEYVRTLREEGSYETAHNVSRLVTVVENVGFQLAGEEEKCKQILEQFVDASKRIEEALLISQKDQDVIEELRKQTITAWSQSDAAAIREQHTRESLENSKKLCEDLTQRVEILSSRSYEEDDLGEGNKATLIKEINRMFVTNEDLNKRLTVHRAYNDVLQGQLEHSKQQYQELFREWDSVTNDTLSNKKRVEILTKKVEELGEEKEKLMYNLVSCKEISETRYKRLKDREGQIKNLSSTLDEISTESASIRVMKDKLEAELKSFKSEVVHTRYEMKQMQNYVRLKEDESRKLIAESESARKSAEKFSRQAANAMLSISRLEQDLLTQKSEMVTAEKERDLMKKACDNLTKEKDKLHKKVESQLKEFERLNAIIQSLKHDNESVKKELLQVRGNLSASIEQEKLSSANVRTLQANIDTVEAEKLFLNEVMKKLNEDIKNKNTEIGNFKVEIENSNQTIEKLNNDYITAVRNIKDTQSKFQRCHEQQTDIEYRMKVYQNQATSTEFRLAAKINESQQLQKKIEKLSTIIVDIQNEHSNTIDELKTCKEELANLHTAEERLIHKLQDKEEEITKLNTRIVSILHDRDLIATEMNRRTDEKIVQETEVLTLRMTIERGNASYNERLQDIRVLKTEVKNLRTQVNVLKRALENTTDMRHEVMQLHRKLNQERVTTKVLISEMATPMNVHRWRKLGNRDPNKFELIVKCQRLQRKSIVQFNQIVKAEEVTGSLREKISELRKEIEKRPGVELHTKLMVTRAEMVKNTKRMKSAVALSRASENDVNLKDHEILQLQSELNEIKRQLFKEKSEKHRAMDEVYMLKKSQGCHF